MFNGESSTFNSFTQPAPITGQGGPFYGVYVGLVTDTQDPDGQGRVRIRLPWATDPNGDLYELWARVATLFAGKKRGSWFIPEPNDEVLVGFEAGNPTVPIVLGAFWNGKDSAPESMDKQNNIRSITSRSGIRLTFDDSEGDVQFTVTTPGGQEIICKDTPAEVEIKDVNGNSIKMDSAGITIRTGSTLTLEATMIKASASLVTVDSAMTKFSGIVKSETNI